jgi:hypothetical protein
LGRESQNKIMFICYLFNVEFVRRTASFIQSRLTSDVLLVRSETNEAITFLYEDKDTATERNAYFCCSRFDVKLWNVFSINHSFVNLQAIKMSVSAQWCRLAKSDTDHLIVMS